MEDAIEIHSEIPAADTKPEDQEPAQPKPLSKNQQRKLRRQQQWEAGREQRRAERKEKRKQRVAKKRAASADQNETDDANGENANKKPRRIDIEAQEPRELAVVLDMSFDELMADNVRSCLFSIAGTHKLID